MDLGSPGDVLVTAGGQEKASIASRRAGNERGAPVGTGCPAPHERCKGAPVGECCGVGDAL